MLHQRPLSDPRFGWGGFFSRMSPAKLTNAVAEVQGAAAGDPFARSGDIASGLPRAQQDGLRTIAAHVRLIPGWGRTDRVEVACHGPQQPDTPPSVKSVDARRGYERWCWRLKPRHDDRSRRCRRRRSSTRMDRSGKPPREAAASRAALSRGQPRKARVGRRMPSRTARLTTAATGSGAHAQLTLYERRAEAHDGHLLRDDESPQSNRRARR